MQEKSGAKQTIENPLDSVKRRLRTRDKMQTVDLRAKRRLVQNAVDFLTFVLLLLQIGEIGSWYSLPSRRTLHIRQSFQ